MKKEDKELLLKDLCARSPYGVKIFVNDNVEILDGVHMLDKVAWYDGWCASDIEEVKPYLFPLSSMTKEQYSKWCDLEHDPLDEILFRDPNLKPSMTTLEHHLLIAKSLTDPINYCYENHFDIYGLIPKGLAKDATGLNIY